MEARERDVDDVEMQRSSRGVASLSVTPPPGLHAIYSECSRIYPDQSNPLQVTAVVKYWFGGPDPLDYISMYVNRGDSDKNIPAHWHYVSFGLSDLHGDGRVHVRGSEADGPSGFGFELTFRLRREPGETAPPTWPAALLQALARYVFQSGNSLCPGDHVPWRRSLDSSGSRIQHMLMASDAQLHPITTPFGTVSFVQEELKGAQQWNGSGILNLIKTIPSTGGPWLITDMRRGETIFDIDPQLQEQVDDGIEADGSNLSGVSGQCLWEDTSCKTGADSSHQGAARSGDDNDKENWRVRDRLVDSDQCHTSHDETEQTRTRQRKDGQYAVLPPISVDLEERDRMSSSEHNQCRATERRASIDCTVTSDGLPTRSFDSVHVTLNVETGSMLPLALRGRLKHGRHFTFKSAQNDVAVTLVPCSVAGAIVTEHAPYAAHGPWLQILLTDDFIDKILVDISDISDVEELTAPRHYSWDYRGLSITLLPNSA